MISGPGLRGAGPLSGVVLPDTPPAHAPARSVKTIPSLTLLSALRGLLIPERPRPTCFPVYKAIDTRPFCPSNARLMLAWELPPVLADLSALERVYTAQNSSLTLWRVV